MPKFKVCKSEHSEIIVEAKDSEEAYDIAHNRSNDSDWSLEDMETTDVSEVRDYEDDEDE